MRTRSISAASALHARPGQKRKTLLKRIWMKKWCYLIILPGMVYFLLFKPSGAYANHQRTGGLDCEKHPEGEAFASC